MARRCGVPKMKIKSICKRCGKSFNYYDKKRQALCSRCRNIEYQANYRNMHGMHKLIENTCENCGIEFKYNTKKIQSLCRRCRSNERLNNIQKNRLRLFRSLPDEEQIEIMMDAMHDIMHDLVVNDGCDG